MTHVAVPVRTHASPTTHRTIEIRRSCTRQLRSGDHACTRQYLPEGGGHLRCRSPYLCSPPPPSSTVASLLEALCNFLVWGHVHAFKVCSLLFIHYIFYFCPRLYIFNLSVIRTTNIRVMLNVMRLLLNWDILGDRL